MAASPIRLRIREVCGAEEHEELRELQLACLPVDQPYDTARGWWWVAYLDDLPIAFAGLSQTWADARMGYLCRAGVLPQMRGRGLQKRLIRVRLAKARRLGMHTVVTDTSATNYASVNSLIASGFRLYAPATRWAAEGALYWRRKINLED